MSGSWTKRSWILYPEEDIQRDAEEAEFEEEEYQNPDDGYIGFGSRSTAPRIVVQMFTEEKRLEMDLEGLWEVRNSRRSDKAERADAEAEKTNPSSDVWGGRKPPVIRNVDSALARDEADRSRPVDVLTAN